MKKFAGEKRTSLFGANVTGRLFFFNANNEAK
jgi:hypothetical protein